mmetsp:Transcript_17278/g.49498  ORF Transcript_17278/g.49498 Transcript_17278/m.49498 type:complete len:518 (+) Transcript_17278:51-1604(+)
MSTKKVNKYNVKAIRKDLDSCIRSYSWKRFRTVLKSCCPPSCFDEGGGPSHADDGSNVKPGERADEVDTSLLQAVVMDRAKSVRGTPSSHPTLLHALIDKINSGSCTSKSGYGRRAANQLPPPYDIIDMIARHVPQALLVQEGRNGRTPLFLAINRNACPSIIESLIENDASKQSLHMVDRRSDTPIISYIKTADMLDFDEGGIGYLLLKDEQGKETLMKSGGKKDEAPLFYVAAKELRGARLLHLDETQFGEDVRIPDTLRFILVKTYNAWKRLPPNESAARNLPTFDLASTSDVPLLSVFASAISCSYLFYEFSDRVFTILLHEIKQELGIIQKEGETKLVDERGNTPLHLLMGHYFSSRWRHVSSNIFDPWNHLIECYPESLGLPNEDGNLPLHLAILEDNGPGVRDLCNAFPGAAEHQNIAGELPLHTFLKRAGSFRLCFSPNVLDDLIRAGPDTVAEKDGQTGLYPFQLAVESTSFSAFSRIPKLMAEENEKYLIGFSYKLLKKRPDLCALF